MKFPLKVSPRKMEDYTTQRKKSSTRSAIEPTTYEFDRPLLHRMSYEARKEQVVGDYGVNCGSRNLQATNECCALALRTRRLNQRMNSVVLVKVLSLRSFSTVCFADNNLCFFFKERLTWGLRLNVVTFFW